MYKHFLKLLPHCVSLTFSFSLQIPKVHIATQRLLVMEYCEGGKINDIQYIKDNRLSVNEVWTIKECLATVP